MQTQKKYMLVGMSILVMLIFVISGCSSNPMTSTETLPSATGTNSQVSYDDAPATNGVDNTGGYDTTPAFDPEKTDEEPATAPILPDPTI